MQLLHPFLKLLREISGMQFMLLVIATTLETPDVAISFSFPDVTVNQLSSLLQMQKNF